MTGCLAIALVMVLGGCAIIHKPPSQEAGVSDAKAWQAHQKQLRTMQQWALQGRVSSGKLMGWTGNLNWRQTGQHFVIRLSGPLGAGGLRANGTLKRVHVRTGKRRFTTSHPDALVKQTLGFAFPLSALRYWGRGLPAPGDYDSISVNDKGRLQSLHQNGWHVAVLDYTSVDGGFKLPKRIVLDNGENRMRLVVDRWFDVKTGQSSAKAKGSD